LTMACEISHFFQLRCFRLTGLAIVHHHHGEQHCHQWKHFW
jgi:hypothetical protein